jgi:hypothetical protein
MPAKVAASSPNRRKFGTFVLGPVAQGRNYRVLAASGADVPLASDLAMVLIEWAARREAPCVACVPFVEGRRIVFRARYQGKAAMGEVAFLNGVVLGPDDVEALGHRCWLVLPHIPEPDGTPDFATRELELSVPPDAPSPHQTPFGLAWHDRYIELSDGSDCEVLLLEALDSIDPPEQRARVVGWTTSAGFVPRGALDILRTCQLIVAAGPPPPELADMPALQLAQYRTGLVSVEPPPSWRMWCRFHAEIGRDTAFAPALPRLRWHVAFADRPAEQIAREALRMVTQALPPAIMNRLLSQLILAGAELSAPAQSIAAEYARALAGKTEGRRLIEQLMTMAEAISADFAVTLLEMAEPEAVAALPVHQLAPWIGHALTAARARKLAGVPKARANLVGLLRRCVASRESSQAEFAAMAQIIQGWPEPDRRELLALTIAPYLRMIFERSPALGAALAVSVLRREFYSERAHLPADGKLSAPVIFAVARTIARLRAGGDD